VVANVLQVASVVVEMSRSSENSLVAACSL